MKVIFLDIDGVLQPYNSNKRLPNKMKDLLIIHNLDIYLVGQTRDYCDISKLDKHSNRSIEILDYLKHNKDITDYVVIDDLDLSKDFEENFVQTNNIINEEQIEKCIKILSKKKK